MTLRPYQQEAVDAAMAMLRKSTSPILIEAPTGAGKSHIIAALADELTTISGKSLLCVAPSAELVTQNHEKFCINAGRKASLYSASAGEKSLRHPVIFGTPLTVKNSLDKFRRKFCAVVLDEAHRITPTVSDIITGLRERNENLRVVGLSATPYRLGEGYIYRQDEKGRVHDEERAKAPYFARRVYTIDARHLIDKGWLTPPVVGASSDSYDTSALELDRLGRFSPESVDRAFVGHGRKTAKIVEEIVNISRPRRGVLIFAATVAHAREVLASLPPALSAIVTGATKKRERAKILARFKAQRIKYLVNVSVLTTGFDAPHVDVVALLRATESVALLQQMIGRGLRVFDGKADCLILDYADNVARHCPDGDLFDPEIRAGYSGTGDAEDFVCPDCRAVNQFTLRGNQKNATWDENGYLLDLTGARIVGEYGPEPVHYGRRCNGLIPDGVGGWIRCAYRWTFKKCEECEAENDIAARFCCECREEIVNPNDKLKPSFEVKKSDPTQVQCDEIINWQVTETLSSSGNPMKRVSVVTAWRSFIALFPDQTGSSFVQAKYDRMQAMTDGWTQIPETVTYRKNNRGFYEVLAVNEDP